MLLCKQHIKRLIYFFPLSSIVGDVLYGDSITAAFKSAFVPFYEEAIRRIAEIDVMAKLDPILFPKQAQGCIGVALANQVELRKARVLIDGTSSLDDIARTNIERICYEIKDCCISSTRI